MLNIIFKDRVAVTPYVSQLRTQQQNQSKSYRTEVTSLQIKKHKTHLLFVSDLKMYRRMRLCHNKKAQSLLQLLGGLRAMNGLEDVK